MESKDKEEKEKERRLQSIMFCCGVEESRKERDDLVVFHAQVYPPKLLVGITLW